MVSEPDKTTKLETFATKVKLQSTTESVKCLVTNRRWSVFAEAREPTELDLSTYEEVL